MHLSADKKGAGAPPAGPSRKACTAAEAAQQPLVDTRVLGKPKTYSGQRADWPQCKYVFKACIGALDAELSRSLDAIELQGEAIDFNALSAPAQGHSRTLAFILSQVLQGAAPQLVMNVEGYHGLEAWRQLVRSEEPATGAAQVTQLMAILNAKFDGGVQTFAEQLQKLEGRFLRCEK